MPGGQVITSARGSVAFGLTIALVGLAITTGQGTMTATGGNAASLSGQAITSAQGTFSLDITPRSGAAAFTPSITGIQRVLSQGTVYPRGRSLVATFAGATVPNAQIPLSGQVLTGTQGTITAGPADSPALSGQSVTSASGTVIANYDRALTGLESTSASGTLAPFNTPLTSTGQLLTGSTGVVDPSGFTVTVHLSGQEVTSAQGTLEARPGLTGLDITSAIGTVVQSLDVPLVGQVLTGAQGPTIVEQNADDLFIQSQQGAPSLTATVPLVGTAITGAQGTITLNDGEQALTGSVTTSAAGSVTPDVSAALVGQALLGEQYPVSAPGYAELVGQVINGQQGTIFTDTNRTAALTGSAMTLAIGSVSANPRFTLTTALLNSGIGTMGRSGGNMAQALTGLSATTIQGAVGVVGQNPVLQTPSLEGCGITSGVAAESVTSEKTASSEGCFVTSGRANEVA